MAKLIKFAKMAGVMHEADHTYSTQSTWCLHQLATDVPFIACVINWPCILLRLVEFYNLDCLILFIYFLFFIL